MGFFRFGSPAPKRGRSQDAAGMGGEPPADLADEFARMEAETRKRESHYVFAHVAFRQIAKRDPLQTLALMASERGREALASLYNDIRTTANDEIDIAVGPGDFAVALERFGDHPGFVVTLPRPIRQAEAYMVAVVLSIPIAELSLADKDERKVGIRYFTLELGYGGRTVLCAWEDPNRHCNYGDGPAVEVTAFVAAVAAKCG